MTPLATTLPDGATLPCPGCGLAHPWAPEFAGRKARCGCGHVLKVPAAPAGGYSHTAPGVPPQPPPRGGGAGPADLSEVLGLSRPTAVRNDDDDELPPEVEAELAATGRYGEEDLTQADPRRDLYVPVALLVAGFLLTIVDFAVASKTSAAVAAAAGVVVVGLKLVVGMVMTFAAALLAARFAGINFGPIGPALLKLAGLCLAPSALGDLVTTLLGGDMAVAQIGWAVMAVVYYVLISYLFRLDGGQTVIVVFAITIVKVIMFFVLGAAVLVGMGSMIEDAGERVRDGGQDSAITSYEADDED